MIPNTYPSTKTLPKTLAEEYSYQKFCFNFSDFDKYAQGIFLTIIFHQMQENNLKPPSITLKNASHLTEDLLKPLLHSDLKVLVLEGCKRLKSLSVLQNCPLLEELTLNNSGVGFLSEEIELPRLNFLAINNCQEIRAVNLHCPELQRVEFNNNPCLKNVSILEIIGKINFAAPHWFNYRSMKCVRELKGHMGAIHALALFDGTLASGSQDGSIKLWDPLSGDLKGTLNSNKGAIFALTVLDNGSLASGSEKGCIHFWNPTSHTLIGSIPNAHKYSVLALAAFGNGGLVSSSLDRTIKIWSVNGIMTKEIKCDKAVTSFNRFTNGLSCSADNQVIHIKKRRPYDEHTHKVDIYVKLTRIEMLPDYTVAGIQPDGGVRVWDGKSGRNKYIIAAHNTDKLVFSLIGKDTVVTMPMDNNGTIKLWDLSDGKLKQTLPGHTGPVRSVTYLQDKHLLITGSDDHTIKIWR